MRALQMKAGLTGLLWLGAAACNVDSRVGVGEDGSSGGLDDAGEAASTGSNAEAGESVGESGGGTRLDVAGDGGDGPGDTRPEGASCKVSDNMDAFVGCDDVAPPDSFDPAVEWSWTGPAGARLSQVMPLVANLTDDNGDGAIDLCDIPDVVMVGADDLLGNQGALWVLDGASGDPHYRLAEKINNQGTPAIGDVDNDGVPEIIVKATIGLSAFKADGSLLWTAPSSPSIGTGAIGLADLDNDGDTEIYGGVEVHDHLGTLLWSAPDASASAGRYSAPTAADLDGDGDLELLFAYNASTGVTERHGLAVYHHDGTEMWRSDDVDFHFPQVANMDDDPEPEIVVTGPKGYGLLNHDGSTVYAELHGTLPPPAVYKWAWARPASIHDFNGDGRPEFAQSSSGTYMMVAADGSELWQQPVSDGSGLASSTAFDFLGDGVAEAIYGDEEFAMVFDGATGGLLLQTPRSSRTLIEYPVVADVDNDGSAEIVVTAGDRLDGSVDVDWTVQVVGDAEDRWIQPRRIWNQHTYHVTNVREDGTIPQFERPNWEVLNTFRTQAQIDDSGVCNPRPAG